MSDAMLPIAGGVGLALLTLIGLALAMRRRRRRNEDEESAAAEQYESAVDEAPTQPDPLFAEPAFAPLAAQPAFVPPVVEPAPALAPAPAVAAAPAALTGSAAPAVAESPAAGPCADAAPGSHVEAACGGPTEDNPSLSIKKRLKRAHFFDEREQLVAAGMAVPVETDAGLPDALVEPAAEPEPALGTREPA